MDAESFPRINRVVLTGFIQQDPELRFTPGGIPVASFRMRIARLLPENRGAKETVSYITVVAWQELAQKVSRDGRNGQGVAIEGFLHSRSFSTARGERRTAIEVYADSLQLAPVFLPPTADQSADRAAHERDGSDGAGSERAGSDRAGADRAGGGKAGGERRQGGGQSRGSGRGPRRPVESTGPGSTGPGSTGAGSTAAGPIDAEPTLPFPADAPRRGESEHADEGHDGELSNDKIASDDRHTGYLGASEDAGPAH